MNDDIQKMIDNLREVPIMLRYPYLLVLCNALFKELKDIEEEYEMIKQQMLLNLMEVIQNKEHEDEC